MTRPAGPPPPDRLVELVDLLCDGRADAREFAELEAMLRDDREARRYYLEAIELHASLRRSRLPAMRAAIGEGLDGDDDGAAPRGPGGAATRPGRAWRLLSWAAAAVAAAVLLAVATARMRPGAGDGRGRGVRPAEAVATLVAAEGARWAGPSPSPPAIGEALAVGRTVRLDAGSVRLRFGRDATVTVEGPAEVEIRSAMRVRAVRGKVTARVGLGARGFTVETPHAEVVDLGTEFGLEVDPRRTGVVVFRGAIDLSYGAARDQKRLTQGEALRVGPRGDMTRIVSVERRPDDGRWSTGEATGDDAVIQGVGDNIRGLGSTKYYQIVPHGLVEDAPAYVDRPHEWNGLDGRGLPEFLRGADYVMPFNDDKRSRDIRVEVTLARAAALYVLFDDRAEVPAWLAEQFADTGLDVGLDEGPSLERDLAVDAGPGRSIDTVFSVWRRDVDGPAAVTLGAMVDKGPGKAMYGIAAAARRGADDR